MSKIDFSISGDAKGHLLDAAGYFGLALAGGVVGIIGGVLGMKSLFDYVGTNGLLDVTIDHTVADIPEETEVPDEECIDVEDYTISDISEEGAAYEHD